MAAAAEHPQLLVLHAMQLWLRHSKIAAKAAVFNLEP
jgi:hypothetical protein